MFVYRLASESVCLFIDYPQKVYVCLQTSLRKCMFVYRLASESVCLFTDYPQKVYVCL